MSTGTSMVRADASSAIVATDKAQVRQVKPSLPDIPALGKTMGDVFKAGGLPLTLLFVAALVMVGLIAKGVVSQALGFFQTVTVILTISSVVTLLALAGIAYARWRAELDVRRDVYRSETELQDKFILELTQYVLAMAKPGWGPADLKNTLDGISNSMVGLIRGVSTARQDLRTSVIVPPTAAQSATSAPGTQQVVA